MLYFITCLQEPYTCESSNAESRAHVNLSCDTIFILFICSMHARRPLAQTSSRLVVPRQKKRLAHILFYVHYKGLGSVNHIFDLSLGFDLVIFTFYVDW